MNWTQLLHGSGIGPSGVVETPAEPLSLRESRRVAEKARVQDAIERHPDNMETVAAELGVPLDEALRLKLLHGL